MAIEAKVAAGMAASLLECSTLVYASEGRTDFRSHENGRSY